MITLDQITTLRRFVGPAQIFAILAGVRGEEKEYFAGIIAEYAARFETMPKTYEQDGLGDQAVAYLHYFGPSQDWYITERDMEAAQHQAFGLADLFGDGGELGYISIVELIQNGIELDLHWHPRTLAECRARKVAA